MKRHILYGRIDKIMRSDSYLKLGKDSLFEFYKSVEDEVIALSEYDIKFATYLTNIYAKYDLFYKTLTDQKYNKDYKLAIELQDIINGTFDITSLDAVEFKVLKEYYENEYRYYIAFRPDEVKRLDNIISTLSRNINYKNAVNFTCGTEANEYIRKAINENKKLAPEMIEYIEKYAINLNNPQVNASILKLYTDVYHVGESMNLDKDTFNKDLDNLYEFIVDDKFEENFGRKYDIVDMYLTTNLQVVDLFDINANDYDIEKLKVIKGWIAEQYSLITRIDDNRCAKNSRLCLINFPANHQIEHFKKLDYKRFAKNKYTKEDVIKAEEILIDLNMLYGVKYDILTLAHIVDSYKEGNDLSYYDVADHYFANTIQNTYINVPVYKDSETYENKTNRAFIRRYKKENEDK